MSDIGSEIVMLQRVYHVVIRNTRIFNCCHFTVGVHVHFFPPARELFKCSHMLRGARVGSVTVRLSRLVYT